MKICCCAVFSMLECVLGQNIKWHMHFQWPHNIQQMQIKKIKYMPQIVYSCSRLVRIFYNYQFCCQLITNVIITIITFIIAKHTANTVLVVLKHLTKFDFSESVFPFLQLFSKSEQTSGVYFYLLPQFQH